MGADKPELVETDEFWAILVQGYRVTRITIDFRFGVELEGEEESDRARVAIGAPFTYTDAGRRSSVLDPEGTRRRLGPALDCFDLKVQELHVRKADGQLDLSFIDGSGIEVEPLDEYEAWEIAGPGSLKLVCMPGGGEPAIWR